MLSTCSGDKNVVVDEEERKEEGKREERKGR